MESDKLKVSIPERDYKVLRQATKPSRSASKKVSIPERDYKVLRLIFKEKCQHWNLFQSLKGIIRYCDLDCEPFQ